MKRAGQYLWQVGSKVLSGARWQPAAAPSSSRNRAAGVSKQQQQQQARHNSIHNDEDAKRGVKKYNEHANVVSHMHAGNLHIHMPRTQRLDGGGGNSAAQARDAELRQPSVSASQNERHRQSNNGRRSRGSSDGYAPSPAPAARASSFQYGGAGDYHVSDPQHPDTRHNSVMSHSGAYQQMPMPPRQQGHLTRLMMELQGHLMRYFAAQRVIIKALNPSENRSNTSDAITRIAWRETIAFLEELQGKYAGRYNTASCPKEGADAWEEVTRAMRDVPSGHNPGKVGVPWSKEYSDTLADGRLTYNGGLYQRARKIIFWSLDINSAPFRNRMTALKEGLETLFGQPVDLVTEPSMRNPFLIKRVQAERLDIYGS